MAQNRYAKYLNGGKNVKQVSEKKTPIKQIREVASFLLPNMLGTSIPLPDTKLPRVDLPESKNSILNFLLSVGEDLANQPASSIESASKLNRSQRQFIAGETPELTTPQEFIGESANMALLPLSFYGGGSVGSVIKSGLKTGLKSAIKQGVKSGIKAGGSFGAAEGLKSGKDKDTLTEQLVEGGKGMLAGGTLGGVTGGILPSVTKIASKVLPKGAIQTTQKSEKAVLKNALQEGVEGVDGKVPTPLGQDVPEAITQPQNTYSKTVSERLKSYTDNAIDQGDKNGRGIAFIDFRTPEHVLEKLGLHSKVYMPLKRGLEKSEKEIQEGYGLMNKWYQELGKSKDSELRVFEFLDGQPVSLSPTEQKVAGEIREYFKQWADKLELPEDKRITNYISHLFEPDLKENQIPDELVDLLEYTKQSGYFNPFLEQRKGAPGYKKELFTALDAYIQRSAKKLYLDTPIKSAINQSEVMDRQGRSYINKLIERLKNKPDLFEKTVQENLLDGLPESVRTRLGYRPVKNLSRGLTQFVYRGTLGLNLNSALKNLTQVTNTLAELGEKYTLIGYKDLLKKGKQELIDNDVLSDILRAEYKTTNFKRRLEKMDKVLFWLFENAEMVNRGSVYFGSKAKSLSQGMSEQQAVEAAKKTVRKTQFGFGPLDSPLAFQTSWGKPLFQFGSYPLKQFEMVGGFARKKEWKKLARYIASSLFLTYSIGDLLGFDAKDMLFRNMIVGPGPIPDTALAGFDVAHSTAKGQTPNYENVYKLKSSPKLVIPAGVQADKSFQGVQAIEKGGVFTKTGREKYPIESTEDKIRSILFGPWRSKAALKKEKEESFNIEDLMNLLNITAPQKTNRYEKYSR